MTILPIYKRCPRCHRIYSWNPDAGKLWCPHCGPLNKQNGSKGTIELTAADILAERKIK